MPLDDGTGRGRADDGAVDVSRVWLELGGDVGEHDGQLYLVMEVIRGVTVQQRLIGTPLKATALFELGAQLADALDAAHAEQIIHRDIKPANVFITDRGHAKLRDF